MPFHLFLNIKNTSKHMKCCQAYYGGINLHLKQRQSKIFKFTSRTLMFTIKTEKESLYKILLVKPSASQDEIKKSYYTLAKKYHPDFNPLEEKGDQFKRVQKAYEVLSHPMTRQTYDIENRFNEDLSNDIKDTVYASKLGRKNYYVGRQMTDFYHTQWTDYKKPHWYHPYNGYDVRSQYLYRKKQDDRMWDLPPYVDIAFEYIEEYRIYLYLLAFAMIDAYWFYRSYINKQKDNLDLELLNESFSLDMLNSGEDDDSVIFDESKMADDKKLGVRLALNDYMNQRIAANAKPDPTIQKDQ
jgi:hypothetical protein